MDEIFEDRIYTYVILRDKITESDIVVINTHLDNSNQTVRQKQWNVLAGEMERFKDYPIILSGDFGEGE